MLEFAKQILNQLCCGEIILYGCVLLVLLATILEIGATLIRPRSNGASLVAYFLSLGCIIVAIIVTVDVAYVPYLAHLFR